MEDGEINDTSSVGELECDHDPSLEWPTSHSGSNTPVPDDLQGHANARSHSKAPSWVTMRLVVIKSSILPRVHRLAIVDGYSQLQFGRDAAPAGTDIPRIRLKEMEVSKIHATAYWDRERREWAVVDMGSKHGTFLKASVGESAERGIRLSPSKVASVPRKLRHLDFLNIGSTTFQIHIHRDQVPCVECSLGGGEEIPLFPVVRVKDEISVKRARDTAGMETVGAVGLRDPKKALTMLKRTLLTRHDDDRVNQTRLSARGGINYMDRSARRRELHPTPSDSDAPGVSAPKVDVESSPSPLPSSPCNGKQFAETFRPPGPLPATNIGHRLLMKQGWQPGTSLGLPVQGKIGLLVPLEVSSNANRAGLGMLSDTQALQGTSTPTSWKEMAKRKRWQNIRLDTNDKW